MSGFWVFGYGSLMWRPGFEYLESTPAVLDSFNRSFCVYSVYHRGTAARPGLVLGLDQGGVCHGMAYRLAPENVASIIAYLRAREQVTGVYRETFRQITLRDGSHRRAEALCYVVERAHPQYTGGLPLRDQAHIIRHARGRSGANAEYFVNTVARLRALGIRDAGLERLFVLLGRVVADRAGAATNGGGRARMVAAPSASLSAPPLSRTAQSRFNHRRNLVSGLSGRLGAAHPPRDGGW